MSDATRADPPMPVTAGCGFLSDTDLQAAIEGRLSAARRSEFERHVEQGCAPCTLLAADLEVFSAVLAGGVVEAERQESERQSEMMQARLRREVRGRARAPGSKAWGTVRHWGLAAAAILVGAVVWQTSREPHRPGSLSVALPGGGTYVAAVKPFDAPPVLRGERNLEVLWRGARHAYDRGRYKEAEALLGEIVAQQADAVDARVYRGICLLALGHAKEARTVLADARAQAQEQDVSTTSVAWFEALTAIEDDDVAAARAALDEAAGGTGPYAESAKELRARLP